MRSAPIRRRRSGRGPLRDLLVNDLSLGSPPDRLFEWISYVTGGERRKKAKLLSIGEDPDGDASTLDVLAALENFQTCGRMPKPSSNSSILCSRGFIRSPLRRKWIRSACRSPSIMCATSSVSAFVAGVASSWLSEALKQGTKLRAYIQKAHAFALPQNLDVPHHHGRTGNRRRALPRLFAGAPRDAGDRRSLAFFGHQHRAADFFYEDEWKAHLADGSLTKLSLAWSRDGDTKTYVQDKIRVESEDLYDWIARGAHFYICGDAKRMAGDVERALVEIIAKHGDHTETSAKAFVVGMKKAGRYQTGRLLMGARRFRPNHLSLLRRRVAA